MPPDPDAYRRALLLTRQQLAASRAEVARAILGDLRRWITFLEAEMVRAGISLENIAEAQTLAAAARINEDAAQRLLSDLVGDLETGRVSTFEATLDVWERSGLAAASEMGLADATLSRLRAPPVTLLGAYESINASENWRTLLRGHVSSAATEANAIIRRAMLEGVSRDETARRLRRYVVGAEDFEDAFSDVETPTGTVKKLDLRGLSAEDRDAARQMEFNARRIASAELRNASHEAQVQHMMADPLIVAISWELSPLHRDVDVCDVLATADHYGLGPGVYPVGAVPAPPHPFDACANRSVARPAREADQPKPDPDRRSLSDSDVVQQVGPLRGMKRERADRIVREARGAVERGEEALRVARAA